MDFSKLDGLIPAVVQDEISNEVLMVGFMNEEAWGRTRQSGYVTFFSRTRKKLWMKGETSGNRLAGAPGAARLRRGHGPDQGAARGRRQRLSHRAAQSCFFNDHRERRSRESGDETAAGYSEGIAAGRDDPAVPARRLRPARRFAVVLSVDRRSRDRVHADSRAGNGALRRRRRPRCGAHRPGLDRRARDRPSGTVAARADLRSDLREAEFRQGPLGAGRAGGFAVQERGRSERQADRDRAGSRHEALLHLEGHERRRRILVGRDRSEAAGARRRDRRGDRDRIDAARQPAADSRDHHGIEHPARSPTRRRWPIRGRRPRSKTSRCC